MDADALAVARETMRRARHNIATLLPRLTEHGYRFGYAWILEDALSDADERAWAEAQPPVLSPPASDVTARIAELEVVAGVLPLSLRAFYEEVGGVNFVGDWPETAYDWRVEQALDPLRVESLEDALEACRAWRRWGASSHRANSPADDVCPVPIARILTSNTMSAGPAPMKSSCQMPQLTHSSAWSDMPRRS